MNDAVFVLLMLWTAGDYRGGMTVIQQEFNSKAACEIARAELAKAHNGGTDKVTGPRFLAAQGCFKK